jgi:hypothetical protein
MSIPFLFAGLVANLQHLVKFTKKFKQALLLKMEPYLATSYHLIKVSHASCNMERSPPSVISVCITFERITT